MAKGISFTINTTDFDAAVDTLEKFYKFKDSHWLEVKESDSFRELNQYLYSVGVFANTFGI